jgi:hypothetical protein
VTDLAVAVLVKTEFVEALPADEEFTDDNAAVSMLQ